MRLVEIFVVAILLCIVQSLYACNMRDELPVGHGLLYRAICHVTECVRAGAPAESNSLRMRCTL